MREKHVNERMKSIKTYEESSRPFESILHNTILDGMRNVLGEGATHAVLFHLGLLQCAVNPREFHQSLLKIFGRGAVTLEKMVFKEMCRKLGLPHQEMRPFDFPKLCELAEQILMTRNVGVER